MAERIVLRKPGQNKIARYRHTQSCIRLAGFAPGREREKEIFRCRVLAVLYLLMILAGAISICR
jgi:hypothetical protein